MIRKGKKRGILTSESRFAGANVCCKVTFTLAASHAVIWPAWTLVVLTLVTLVSIVEEALTSAVVRAVS